MEKAKLIEIFSGYAKNYDFDDPIIALKFNHGLSVANLSYDIAESLAMSEEEKMLSYLIGLVHEIGSFENWKKTKTYQDTLTTKQVLFDEKFIDKFSLQKNEKKIIEFVIDGIVQNNDAQIKKHTEKLKNGKSKEEKIIRHREILLDANILDLFGMMKRKSLPVVLAQITKETLSKTVFKTFKTENKASVEDVKSKLDEVIYFLSLFYDLKFNYSVQYALKIDFAYGIYDYFQSELSDREKERLSQIIEDFKQKYIVKE